MSTQKFSIREWTCLTPSQIIRDMPGKLRSTFRKLYIGEWLARLSLKQEHVAKEVGIEPSYLSDLISGKKSNPSARLLLAISEAMGVPMNKLYEQPPSAAHVQAIKTLPAELVQRLADAEDRK